MNVIDNNRQIAENLHQKATAWAVALDGDANWWLCYPFGEPKPIMPDPSCANEKSNTTTNNTNNTTATDITPTNNTTDYDITQATAEATISVHWLYPVKSKSIINKCRDNNPSVFFPAKGDLLFQKKGSVDEIVVDLNIYNECQQQLEKVRDNRDRDNIESKVLCQQFSKSIICHRVVIDYCFTRAPRSYEDKKMVDYLKSQCEYFAMSSQEEARVTELYRSQFLDVSELIAKEEEDENKKSNSKHVVIESDDSYEDLEQIPKPRRGRGRPRKVDVAVKNSNQKTKSNNNKVIYGNDFQLLEGTVDDNGKISEINLNTKITRKRNYQTEIIYREIDEEDSSEDTDGDYEALYSNSDSDEHPVRRRGKGRKTENKKKSHFSQKMDELTGRSKKARAAQEREDYYIEFEKRFFDDDDHHNTMNTNINISNHISSDISNISAHVEVLPPELEAITDEEESSILLAPEMEFSFVTSVDTITGDPIGDTYTSDNTNSKHIPEDGLLWSHRENTVIGSCRTISTVQLSTGNDDTIGGNNSDMYDIVAVTIPPCSNNGKKGNIPRSKEYLLSTLVSKPVKCKGSNINNLSRKDDPYSHSTTQRRVVSSTPLFKLQLTPSISSLALDSLRCHTVECSSQSDQRLLMDAIISARDSYKVNTIDRPCETNSIHSTIDTVTEGRHDSYEERDHDTGDPVLVTSRAVPRKRGRPPKNRMGETINNKRQRQTYIPIGEVRDGGIEVIQEETEMDLDPLERCLLDAQRDLLYAVTMAKNQ